MTEQHRHYTLRTFDVEFEGERRSLRQFAYLAWPDHGVPLTTAEVLGFRNAVRQRCSSSEAPLLVHCSAGVGRTGTYIAIDRLVEQTLAGVRRHMRLPGTPTPSLIPTATNRLGPWCSIQLCGTCGWRATTWCRR